MSEILPKRVHSEVVVLASMDNTIDHTFESANRVYSKYGCCPTIPTCAGGNIQPKILVEDDEESIKSRNERKMD